MTVSILIADDEENIRDVCRRYLEREGFNVWMAEDGEAAVWLWREQTPDMVILDVMMPKKSGLRVCEEIRNEQDTPVILSDGRKVHLSY